MTTRPNAPISVSSTDILIAMLSSDLRGSWAEAGCALPRREPVDPTADPTAGLAVAPVASAPLIILPEAPEPEESGR